jgi:hypothetical protein
MLRFLSSLLVFLLSSYSFFSFSARADEMITHEVLQTPQGLQHFTLHRGVNANGEMEVQIEHDEIRKLFPGETRHVVLYGRDLDGDGKVDAWFYPGKSGIIESVDTGEKVRPLKDSDTDSASRAATDLSQPDPQAWEQATQIILQQSAYENRWISGIVAEGILSRISVTDSVITNLKNELTPEEIDLRDMEIRTDRLASADPMNPELTTLYAAQANGWAGISEELSEQGIRDSYLYAASDIALYASGAVIARGLGSLMEWISPRMLQSAPALWAGSAFDSLQSAFSDAAANASQKLSEHAQRLGVDLDALQKIKSSLAIPLRVSGNAAGAIALKEFFSERLPLLIRGLAERSKMSWLLAKTFSFSKGILKGVSLQWKYLVATQTVELGTEIYQRRDTLYSPNPIIFAKNVMTNKDLIQDMSFMTLDNSLQMGASAADSNMKRRMAIAAAFSFTDSTVVNVLINRSDDMTRTAMDTGWQMSVGNLQTQIDVVALQSFEKIATRTDNPKLKLIGYAIGLINDNVGNAVYEHITEKYEQSKREHPDRTVLSWIPIFAEK